MTSSDNRLDCIYRQEPDLKPLRYAVTQATMVFSPGSAAMAAHDPGEYSKKYLYTFFAPTGGGSEMQIKVTVDEHGQILKLIMSK